MTSSLRLRFPSAWEAEGRRRGKRRARRHHWHCGTTRTGEAPIQKRGREAVEWEAEEAPEGWHGPHRVAVRRLSPLVQTASIPPMGTPTVTRRRGRGGCWRPLSLFPLGPHEGGGAPPDLASAVNAKEAKGDDAGRGRGSERWEKAVPRRTATAVKAAVDHSGSDYWDYWDEKVARGGFYPSPARRRAAEDTADASHTVAAVGVGDGDRKVPSKGDSSSYGEDADGFCYCLHSLHQRSLPHVRF